MIAGNIKAIASGKTTITVKAEENSIQAQIEISVYSKVTNIVIDEKEIYMCLGDTIQINGYVEPNDANNKEISYSSTNKEIVAVNQDGLITALQEGNVSIIARSKENPNIKAECKVSVVRPLEDSQIHFDSSLTVNGLEISGIDYGANTVLDIKNKITTDLEIEILNYKNEPLNDTDIVGTGSKIIVKENGGILTIYRIIIYGDANGDGKINSTDLLVIQRHILEIENLKGIFKKASNIRKDGKKPTSVDLLLIQRHILDLKKIEQ